MQHASRTQKKETQRKLLAYSAAAGAVMAGGGAAEGAIIHSGAMDQAFGTDSNYYDLTMEGSTMEFRFKGSSATVSSPAVFFALMGTSNNNNIMVTSNSNNVSQLGTSQSVKDGVGASSNSFGAFFVSSNYLTTTQGEWDEDEETAYMGFTFETEAGSQQVYGWAEIERVDASNGKLLGWAYEDSGDPIQVGAVPEPHSLALLALGAAGVAALRRRRG